jgi:hypothetical protein
METYMAMETGVGIDFLPALRVKDRVIMIHSVPFGAPESSIRTGNLTDIS